MRITTLLAVPILATLIALPTRAAAQVTVNVPFGTQLGPEIGFTAYSPERNGALQANYQRWTPVTLYDVNGHYYREPISGARAVQVYSYDNEYFLPPQGDAQRGRDRRLDDRQRPTAVDLARVRTYRHEDAVDPRLGPEINVQAYSADRAGDWRVNAGHWKPVTVYQINGRYYRKNGTGATPVSAYRYRSEYFLPPTDPAWTGSDRRFNNNGHNGNRGRGRESDKQ